MPVLTDKNIIENVYARRLIISPFNEDALTPTGYDLTLSEFDGLKPKEFKIFTSKEMIEMPDNMIAIILLRTTYIFKGLIMSTGVVDAGFKGHLKIALHNPTDKTVKAEAGELERPVTMMFMNAQDAVALPFGHRHIEQNNIQ
jgi:deoxycytidine triphosphate deaminase